jgi:hypothetical protein
MPNQKGKGLAYRIHSYGRLCLHNLFIQKRKHLLQRVTTAVAVFSSELDSVLQCPLKQIKVFVTTGAVTRGSRHAVAVVTWYRMPDLAANCLFRIFVGCCVLELVAVPWF